MINSLEKVDISGFCYWLNSEDTIRQLKEFLRLYVSIIIIRKSASILFDKEDNNND